MLVRAIRTLQFAGVAAFWFMFLVTMLICYSLVKHGDRGPWPEVDYVAWMAAPAALLARFTED